MVRVADQYIVGKNGKWLKSSRPDLLRVPTDGLWSIYVHDAKRFNTRQEAKRKARMVGGTIWLFNPATGSKSEIVSVIPPGAKCDNCRKWTPFDGICRNPESEYCREPVSMEDVCDEWEEKEHGRKRQTDSTVNTGRGPLERPGAGSGGKSLL